MEQWWRLGLLVSNDDGSAARLDMKQQRLLGGWAAGSLMRRSWEATVIRDRIFEELARVLPDR